MVSAACASVLISPTAADSRGDSERTFSANGTWYPGAREIRMELSTPPEVQSMRSAPAGSRARAAATVSSGVQPPSTQSEQDNRTMRARSAPIVDRTAAVVSTSNFNRPSHVSPYSSSREFARGE
jgi:hypothetical protein